MATIAFMIDQKEGHIIPSFKLAITLKENGHDVFYMSVPDNEEIVITQGFKFYPLFEDIYPSGFVRQNKELMDMGELNQHKLEAHLKKMMTGELDGIMETINPDMFVLSGFLRVEAMLLYYKYGIRPVILTTYLRPPDSNFTKDCMSVILSVSTGFAVELVDFVIGLGIQVTSLVELLQPAGSFHELVLCPKEIDLDNSPTASNVHYIGPSIFHERKLGDKPEPSLTRGRRLIYASLGSHAIIYRDACRHFFSKIVNVMMTQALSDCHLILSVGNEFDPAELPVAENVTIMKWVSQIDVLQEASLVLTHGGLGTIKESIYYGVPLIVFPMLYDQFRNAGMIDFHGLGKKGDIEEISESSLSEYILYVLNDPGIRNNIREMQKVFREKDAAQEGVEIIERLLDNSKI